MYYFLHKVNKEVREVYWQTLLSNLAISLVFIFEPIYLYTLGYSLISILWFYVFVYSYYILLVGFVQKIACRIGYKHSIFISTIFYVIYWIALYSIRVFPALFFIAPLFFALQKSFFWPSLNVDLALNDDKDQNGREVGALLSIVQFTLIISPLLGGLMSGVWGFRVLFSIASLLMVFSSWPLFLSPEIYTKHRFKFSKLWQVFKRYRINFFGYWGFAEDLMIMSLWPVFIFVAAGKVEVVGAISTAAMMVAAMLMLYVGRQADHIRKEFLIERNSIFYGLSWIFRFLASGIPAVLIFDVLTKTLKGLVQTPVMAFTFEIAGSKDPDFASAYAVFYEFSLSLGKVLTALAGIAILAYTNSIFVVFGFVGILTMFYGFLSK